MSQHDKQWLSTLGTVSEQDRVVFSWHKNYWARDALGSAEHAKPLFNAFDNSLWLPFSVQILLEYS